MDEIEAKTILLGGGLLIGVLFGALSQRSAFCFRRVIVDAKNRQFGKAAILYFSALSLAIAGTQLVLFFTDVNMDGTIQLSAGYSIGGLVFGGLVFGVGMALTNGCPLRHIILAAEGSARSWFVLFLVAITGYATIRGILTLIRLPIENAGRVTNLDENEPLLTIPQFFSANPTTHLIVGLLIGGGIAAFIMIKAIRHHHMVQLGYGAAIGLLIPATWFVTGNLGYDEFDPVAAEGVSFIAPLSNGLQYLMTYTGATANFGITLLAGCLMGAIVSAIVGKNFAFRSFEHEKDILRYTIGAMMLGFGSVTALGCSIGQGLTGLSLLSLSSVVAVIAIAAGGYAGLNFVKKS